MKTVKRTEQIYTAKDVKIDVFIADDSREFKTEEACLAHESKLSLKKSVRRFISTVEQEEMPYQFMFADTQKKLQWVKKEIGWNTDYRKVYYNDKNVEDLPKSELPVVGEWIGSVYEDGGDYRDTVYVYSLKYIKHKLSKLIGEIDDILV